MRLSLTTLVVPEYDPAVDYFTRTLGFFLITDKRLGPEKRWVVVSPSEDGAHGLLLAKATSERQKDRIGDQSGGRVSFFLETDDFQSTYSTFLERGVKFTESPRAEDYGMVVVFEDIYGNRWDLLGTNSPAAGG